MSQPENTRIRPLGLGGSIVIFLIPATILYLAHYYLVPWLVSNRGWPYLNGYLLAWFATMALFFCASIAAYRLEGNPIQLMAFARRYRLTRPSRQDWLWMLAVLIIQAGLYFGLSFTAKWLGNISLFAPHPVFPPEFGPAGAGAHIPGALMGTQLEGKYWIIVVYFFGWLFNIFGEELWFRGYILPRQEHAFTSAAWIANGLMFGLNHIWQPWNMLMILPGALVGVYIVQRRKNTWVLLVPHGLLNAALMVVILLNVAGTEV